MREPRPLPEGSLAERTRIAREYTDRVTRIAGLSQREPLIHEGFEYTAEPNLTTNVAIEGPTLFIRPVGAEEDKIEKFEMHLQTVTLSRYVEDVPTVWGRAFGNLLHKSGIEKERSLKLEQTELDPHGVATLSKRLAKVIEDSTKLKSVE